MEKYLLSNLKRKNFAKSVNGIYLETDYNHKQYPGYTNWYYTKAIPRVLKNEGEIVFMQDAYNTAGIAILKNTKEEKKICTLLVVNEYQKKGYSKALIEECIKYLDTDYPLITIPANKIASYQSIIKAYNWKITGETNKYFTKEYIINENNK